MQKFVVVCLSLLVTHCHAQEKLSLEYWQKHSKEEQQEYCDRYAKRAERGVWSTVSSFSNQEKKFITQQINIPNPYHGLAAAQLKYCTLPEDEKDREKAIAELTHYSVFALTNARNADIRDIKTIMWEASHLLNVVEKQEKSILASNALCHFYAVGQKNDLASYHFGTMLGNLLGSSDEKFAQNVAYLRQSKTFDVMSPILSSDYYEQLHKFYEKCVHHGIHFEDKSIPALGSSCSYYARTEQQEKFLQQFGVLLNRLNSCNKETRAEALKYFRTTKIADIFNNPHLPVFNRLQLAKLCDQCIEERNYDLDEPKNLAVKARLHATIGLRQQEQLLSSTHDKKKQKKTKKLLDQAQQVIARNKDREATLALVPFFENGDWLQIITDLGRMPLRCSPERYGAVAETIRYLPENKKFRVQEFINFLEHEAEINSPIGLFSASLLTHFYYLGDIIKRDLAKVLYFNNIAAKSDFFLANALGRIYAGKEALFSQIHIKPDLKRSEELLHDAFELARSSDLEDTQMKIRILFEANNPYVSVFLADTELKKGNLDDAIDYVSFSLSYGIQPVKNDKEISRLLTSVIKGVNMTSGKRREELRKKLNGFLIASKVGYIV